MAFDGKVSAVVVMSVVVVDGVVVKVEVKVIDLGLRHLAVGWNKVLLC